MALDGSGEGFLPGGEALWDHARFAVSTVQQGGVPVEPHTAPAPAAALQGVPAGGGGQDYSAQLAEYYRSIGKVKEAEAIEAQIRANHTSAGLEGPGPQPPQPQACPGAPGGGQPGSTGQPGRDPSPSMQPDEAI